MDNKEWVKQFEEQNGRKPTPEELAKFLSENKMGEKRKKWGRVIIATLVLATVIVSFFAYQSYIKWTKSDGYFYKYSQVAALDTNQEEEINKFVLEYLKSLDESVSNKSNSLSSYFDSHDNDSYKKVVQEVSGLNVQSIETKKEQTKDYKILNNKIGFTTQSIQKITKNDGKPEIVFYTTNWILIKKDTEYKISSIETQINENIKGTMKDYQPVIDNYLKALKVGNYTPDTSYVNFEIFSVGKTKPYKLYYALYDFDHNGVNELIVAGGNKEKFSKDSRRTSQFIGWDLTVYNVFTLNNGKIIDNISLLGYRYFLTPMSDGSFWFRGPHSGFSGVYAQYKFNELGSQLKKVLEITYERDSKTNKLSIEDENGKKYNQTEVDNLLDSVAPVNSDDMIWIEIGSVK